LKIEALRIVSVSQTKQPTNQKEKHTMKIKTIDVSGKEWFDRVNGNSYCSAVIVLNFGMPDAETVKVPFRYGYGNFYMQAAAEALRPRLDTKENTPLWRTCEEKGIILRYQMQTGCKKREVVNHAA